MTVLFIYHHDERERTHELRDKLQRAGLAVTLAPLGHPVGSEAWQTQFQKDLEEAVAIVNFYTRRAVADEWFLWRHEQAQFSGKPTVPITLEDCDIPAGPPMQMITHTIYADSLDDVVASIKRLKPMTQCFISYAREDEAFARQLAANLRKRGTRVWRDQDDIPKGASWDAEIQKAISRSTHVLLVASPQSVQSPNVLDEIGYALNKDKIVIPLMIADCELPLRVHRAQWIDFRDKYQIALAELFRQLAD